MENTMSADTHSSAKTKRTGRLAKIVVALAIAGAVLATGAVVVSKCFLESRRKSCRRACITNMRGVDSAMQQGVIKEPNTVLTNTVKPDAVTDISL